MFLKCLAKCFAKTSNPIFQRGLVLLTKLETHPFPPPYVDNKSFTEDAKDMGVFPFDDQVLDKLKVYSFSF